MAGRLQSFPAPRLGEAGGSINATLRSVRLAAGLSLDVLAARTNFSKPYLSNVEAGRRRVTAEIAAAYDAALGTGGLLARLLAGRPDRSVGREAEVTRLRRLAVELAAGQGNVVWVEGEPGIGKSSLLATGLAGVAASGCRVLWATADESLARFPLWVLLDRVRADATDADPELSEITALLTGAAGPGPGDVTVAAAERLVMLVERWCAAGPCLIVLDDAQWADEMSLSVWGRLRRLVTQMPLLLAGACRPVPRRPEVAALRRGVESHDGVVLHLGPLRPDAVTELTGELAGAPAGPLLRAAAEQAGGNPLYLREMVEALVREDRVRVGDGRAELTGPAVPQSLAAAIGTRLGFLSDPARQVLRIAALLGPEPTVADLSAVSGRPATELADLVDEAIAAGVLMSTADRIAFRHDLIRTALYEQTPPAVRPALHREAARTLARDGAGVETVADHLLAGGPGTDDWAVDWVTGGAGTALVHRAPLVAVELLERLLARPPAERARRSVLNAYHLAALSTLGRDVDVVRLGPAVLADTVDPTVTGQTAWALAYSMGRLGQEDGVRALLAQTIEGRDLDPVWRARLLACDAMAAVDLTVARHALAECERSGDALAIGYALHAMSSAYAWVEEDDEAAAPCIDRALGVIGDRTEAADLRGLLLTNRAIGLRNQGRVGDLPRAIGEALAATERAGSTPRLVALRTTAADMYFDSGRWDDALAEFAAATELVSVETNRGWRYGTAALIAVHRDERPALDAILRTVEGMELCSGDGKRIGARLRLAQALAAEAAGRPVEAADAALVACLQPGATPLAPVVEENSRWLVPEVVRLALACGRTAEAEAYTRAHVELAETRLRVEHVAGALHCRGLIAADPDLVAAAVAGYEKAGLVLARAQAQENQAVLLAQRGDLDAAGRAYDAAAEEYVRLDAGWDLRRAEARLRPLGLRSRYRIPRRPATGWAALTPTELRVASLVADGLSNPDVAARLHVSRRTVETHVAHILAKLGGRSRLDIGLARPSE